MAASIPASPLAFANDSWSAPRTWHIDAADGSALGFVVIDRVVAGHSCGGIRAGAAVTADEISRIARVMTYKCGFVGLAAGGAKGGVLVPENFSLAQRDQRLADFGRAASALLCTGVWSHGADMGTTDGDIARIRHAAGIGADPALAPAPRADGDATSGRAAGLTVALAAEAALGACRLPLAGARIAVQGAGAVGRAAIQSLAAAGARIVAVSTVAGSLRDDAGLDVPALMHAMRTQGDRATAGGASPPALLEVPCDALLLCAGSSGIDIPRAQRLAARSVVCGANMPFGDDVAQVLAQRGVMVLPDFVAGAGGVLGSTLVAAAGVGADELEPVLRRRYLPLVEQTLASAALRGTTATDEARQRALRTLDACDAAYGTQRSQTLLPDRLAPHEGATTRLLMAVERRCRGSRRLAWAARLLHPVPVARAERVLAACTEAGMVRGPAN
jgi:glutamate dehydrogenase (NAD(P)+)